VKPLWPATPEGPRAKPLRPRVVRIVLILVVLVGAAMAGIGVKVLVDSQHFLATAATANGVVVDVVKVREEDSEQTLVTNYYPVVQFATARERVVRFRGDQGSNPPDYRVGEPVRVLYDPANPRHVKFDTWNARWGDGVALTATGLGLVVIYALLLVVVPYTRAYWLLNLPERKQRAARRGAGGGQPSRLGRVRGGGHAVRGGRHVATETAEEARDRQGGAGPTSAP
jgi:Protein of unknown function (DUF3592)